MTKETFEKILPYFRKTKLVYLQGWGEPLLHPEFFQMARKAKQCGCAVGVTTNGILFTDAIAERMVDEGIDVVGFSLAGADEGQDAVRRGAPLRNVLHAIKTLNRIKSVRGSPTPSVHLAYIVLRSRLNDAPTLPALIKGLGVSQVVLSTLDFVPSLPLSEEALEPKDEAEEDTIRSLFLKIAAAAGKSGTSVHYRMPSFKANPSTSCTENIQRALFVSVDGKVSPCVFTNLPITRGNSADSASMPDYKELTFGNIHNLPLWRIWRSKAYEAFRRSHKDERPPFPCADCAKRYLIEPDMNA